MNYIPMYFKPNAQHANSTVSITRCKVFFKCKTLLSAQVCTRNYINKNCSLFADGYCSAIVVFGLRCRWTVWQKLKNKCKHFCLEIMIKYFCYYITLYYHLNYILVGFDLFCMIYKKKKELIHYIIYKLYNIDFWIDKINERF